jgi:hypothetical protein
VNRMWIEAQRTKFRIAQEARGGHGKSSQSVGGLRFRAGTLV